jgi:GTP-binding protein
VDKLRPREVSARIGQLARELAVDEDQVIRFSAVTGAGRDELAAAIASLLAQPSWRSP